MKTLLYCIAKRNQVSFLLMFGFVFGNFLSVAQAQAPAPEIYAVVTTFKVHPGKQLDYEQFVKENTKPIQMLQRQTGKIVQWIFYKVHFAGGDDPYNYAAVTYHSGWANTQPGKFGEALKAAQPEADVDAFGARLREMRTMVSQQIFYRVNTVEPKTPVATNFIRLDFMKVKPGQGSAYLKMETEDWIPFHQSVVNDGQCSGWALWQLVLPGGSASPYDYVTSNRYGTYAQVARTDYEKIFKKVSPSKNINDIFQRAEQSRNLVRTELWEVVTMLDNP